MAEGNVESSFECYNADVLLNTKMQTNTDQWVITFCIAGFCGFCDC